MNENSIMKEVVEIVADVSGYDEDELTPDKNFYEDLEIDSIKAIEITVAMEKKFGISIKDDEIPKITTIQHAVDLLKKKIQNKG